MSLLVGVSDAVSRSELGAEDLFLLVVGLAMGIIGGKVFLGFPERWDFRDLTHLLGKPDRSSGNDAAP